MANSAVVSPVASAPPTQAELWQPVKDQLGQSFNFARLESWFLQHFSGMVVALVYLLFFSVLWMVVSRSLRLIFKRVNLDSTAASFVQEVLKYTIFCIGLLAALGALGINTTSILASLGVAGLTLGFAAKDTLSNIIAGIFIFWDRPFTTGDLVEIDSVYGRVQEITLRSTRIVTVDGKMVAIPNTNIVSDKVVSYTNFPHLRLDVEVTVGVEENIAQVRELLLTALASTQKYMAEPQAHVVVTALNDYNIALRVSAWIRNEREHVAERFALRELVFNTLRDGQVDMPYETFAVFQSSVSEPLGAGGAEDDSSAASAEGSTK